MPKLDATLRFLASAPADELIALAFDSALGVEATVAGTPLANVLVEFAGANVEALTNAGLVIRTRAGRIISGGIAIEDIPKLETVDGVVRAEASRALGPELDLALPEARVTPIHTGNPKHLGRNVIIGIIDSGIDYLHPAFQKANKKTRILSIWDQRLTPKAGESNPAGFTYGVEYASQAIDNALAAATPLSVVRHTDLPPFHGTHVSGIAAGNGQPSSASGNTVKFVGVAPEADLIVVANTRARAQNERGLGDSADTLDAVQYILTRAAALNRPVVINQSQGDNIGPHDGTSLLEVGIAGLITGPGRVMVKSAGNEGAQDRHAQGTLTAGASQDVKIQVGGNVREVMIDLWYPGVDRMELKITPPGNGATPTQVFTPPTSQNVTFSNGNAGFVDLDVTVPGNNDNRTFILLRPGNGTMVQGGMWTLNLRGATISNGRWHAWIQRNTVARFQAPFMSKDTTISIPGTSPAVITAGSYISRPATGPGHGTLSSFSSCGPTRNGLRAPTIAAPGEELMSAQPGPLFFDGMSGTSMAAPMVTGTVALMLEVRPAKTAADIRSCLEQAARLDGQTGPAAGNQWGAGKLDAAAACTRIQNP